MKARTIKFCSDKKDWLIAIVLFFVTVISRIPDRSHFLYSWDSGNFALGISHFNPAAHQPHPPGYPLYILAGKILNLVSNNANTSLVVISIISASISVSLIYGAGCRIFNRNTGLVAAILLFASPLIWFQSEVALAHIVELPFAVLGTWLLYEVFFNRRYAFTAAVVIGLGCGFRQDVFMFYGPILFIASFRLGDTRKMLAVWAMMLVSVLVWLVPFLYLVGDLSTYRLVSSNHSQMAFQDAFWNKGIAGIFKNGKAALLSALWLLGTATIPLVFLCARMVYVKTVRQDRRIWFFLSLAILPVTFFIATSFSHYGYGLIYSPSLMLLAAFSITMIVENVKQMKKQEKVIMLCGIITLAVGLNLAAYLRPEHLGNKLRYSFGECSHSGIKKTDNEMSAVIDRINQYNPDETLVVFMGKGEDPMYFRQSIYYLPEYRILWLRPDTASRYHEAKGGSEIEPADNLKISLSIQYKKMLVFYMGEEISGKPLQPVGGINVSLIDLNQQNTKLGPYVFQYMEREG